MTTGMMLWILVLCTVAHAQVFLADEETHWRIGAAADASLNIHSTDFRALPGVPNCCPRFASGSGLGPTFGLFAEYQLSKAFALALRASYMSHSALLSADEATTVSVDNRATAGTLHHTVDATLMSVGVEPAASFRVTRGLSFQVGARIASVTTANYHQKEEITDPANAVFVPGLLRVRNDTSGAIPDAATFGAWAFGRLRYEFPMNASGTMTLAPEIAFYGGLTPVVSGLDWRAHAVQLGVAVIYTPQPSTSSPPPRSAEPAPAPITRAATDTNRAGLHAHLDMVCIDNDGKELPNTSIRIEEYLRSRTRPLLPYVFFEENSSDISDRYSMLSRREAVAFRVEELHASDILSAYRHILNIIGMRLRTNPAESITLTGCNSDRGKERAKHHLSQQRAEAVQAYLRDVWTIDVKRMHIVVRDLPASPSTPDSAYGMEENRRVEITASAPEILAPITTSDTLRTATPPALRFRASYQPASGLAAWRLAPMHAFMPLAQFSGKGAVPAAIDWRIDAQAIRTHETSRTLDAALEITDSADEQAVAHAQRQIEFATLREKQDRGIHDAVVDEFGLILFDFDRSEISSANQQLCAVIAGRITPASRVTIDGYSDRVGDPAHNMQLSAERAAAVARILGVPGDRATGRGDGSALYANDTPEGRFYCRTVVVSIETPAQGK